MPPMLRDLTELDDDLVSVWDAFHALSTRRGAAIGMGGAVQLPIAFSEISVAADRFGFAGSDEFDRFLRLISAMDTAYLDHVGKK